MKKYQVTIRFPKEIIQDYTIPYEAENEEDAEDLVFDAIWDTLVDKIKINYDIKEVI